MRLSTVRLWLRQMWQPPGDAEALAHAYHQTFLGSPHGRMVLQDLVDKVYCTIDESGTGDGALVANARRSVVHEILENVDRAAQPEKYRVASPDPDELDKQMRSLYEGAAVPPAGER